MLLVKIVPYLYENVFLAIQTSPFLDWSYLNSIHSDTPSSYMLPILGLTNGRIT